MFKKILGLYFIFTVTFLFAISEGSIKSVMTQKVESITSLLQSGGSMSSKKAQLYPIIDSIFDYRTMSKIALGKKWKSLNSSQQQQFTLKFEAKLKASYFEKLKLYTDQKVVVKNLKKVKSTRIKLYSLIIGKTETYEVIYKFFRSKSGSDWLIYDVDIIGISIIQTYRKQFKAFLRTKSFDELLNSI